VQLQKEKKEEEEKKFGDGEIPLSLRFLPRA